LHDVFRLLRFKAQLLGILDRLQLGLNVLVANDGLNTGVMHIDDQILYLQVLILYGGSEVDEFHWFPVVLLPVLHQVRVGGLGGEDKVLLRVLLSAFVRGQLLLLLHGLFLPDLIQLLVHSSERLFFLVLLFKVHNLITLEGDIVVSICLVVLIVLELLVPFHILGQSHDVDLLGTRTFFQVVVLGGVVGELLVNRDVLHLSVPKVLQDEFPCFDPLLRVLLQHQLQQFDQVRVELGGLLHFRTDNFVDELLQVVVCEGGFTGGHLEDHAAQRVHVTLLGIHPEFGEEFGCHVVGSAFLVLHEGDDTLLALPQVGYLDGVAEIRQFEEAALVEDDVGWLEVPEDDPVAV